jgi:hypothetical protein
VKYSTPHIDAGCSTSVYFLTCTVCRYSDMKCTSQVSFERMIVNYLGHFRVTCLRVPENKSNHDNFDQDSRCFESGGLLSDHDTNVV